MIFFNNKSKYCLGDLRDTSAKTATLYRTSPYCLILHYPALYRTTPNIPYHSALYCITPHHPEPSRTLLHLTIPYSATPDHTVHELASEGESDFGSRVKRSPQVPHRTTLYHVVPPCTIPYYAKHTIQSRIILHHTRPSRTIQNPATPQHTAPFRTIPHHSATYRSQLHHTIPSRIIMYHTRPSRTIPYPASPYHTALSHTRPYHTIPHHTASHQNIPHHITPCCTNISKLSLAIASIECT